MKIDESCCEIKKDSIVQESENGKLFRIINKKGKVVAVCKVDGCLIKGDKTRCDFMFIVGESELMFLVELKGVDHVKALRQIIATAETLKIGSFSGKKKSAIVGSPSPKITSKYQNELFKLAKKFKSLNLDFPIKKNNLIEVSL